MSEPNAQSQLIAADLLRWYAEAGINVAVDETPHDRFAEMAAERAGRAAATPRERPLPAGAAPRQASRSVPPDLATQTAREIAASARTLAELRAQVAAFDGCALKASATRLVFGDGDEAARVMFVGEAPGREEDLQGVPFVGRAGQLLNRMLAAIGLKRSDVYIANIVPWRPPGNRTPTQQETSICKPFVERQIALVSPDILVCLGGPSAQCLLDQKLGILSLRGRWQQITLDGRSIKAMPTLHPAYLLRQPAQKRLAWRDFLEIRSAAT